MTFAVLFFASYVLSLLFGQAPAKPEKLSEDESQRAAEIWEATLQQQFADRIDWLSNSPFSLTPHAGEIYQSYGQWLVNALNLTKKKNATAADLVDLNSIVGWFKQTIVSISLRLGFVVIGMWPLWLLSGLIGFFALRGRFHQKATNDLLGICSRGVSPFYSGVYGPLRSNGSFSGSDLAVPNLAHPEMAEPSAAAKHSLVATLKKFGAYNNTNLDLVRIILHYRDFPTHVEEENSSEEEPDNGMEDKPQLSQTGFVTNAGGTIEQSAQVGVAAVLAAHAALTEYCRAMEKKNISSNQLNAQYATHMAQLSAFISGADELTRTLCQTLTPNRAWAIGHLPASLVATAYLATEAGKCLVYKREGSGFTRISLFPNLQARAILQSCLNFIKEHNGDTRMVLRQAIICSRRHGDFGRAFLPEKMPVESRALRDWLELLYFEPKRREAQAQLVELDAHIEEVGVNFRNGLSRRIRQSVDPRHEGQAQSPLDPSLGRFWKGVSYKSVVIVPLMEVITTALRGIDEGRIKRILHLLQLTRRFQTNISVSARLPGFKRQAVEAQTGAFDLRNEILGGDAKRDLRDRWMIVRRMLTKYNWLSTRIGDDAVPADGVVHGVVTDEVRGLPQNIRMDLLVPLRQRRYDEMLGRQWEPVYYFDNPHPSNIRIYVDYEKYQEAAGKEPGGSSGEGSGGKTPTAVSA